MFHSICTKFCSTWKIDLLDLNLMLSENTNLKVFVPLRNASLYFDCLKLLLPVFMVQKQIYVYFEEFLTVHHYATNN